MGLDMYLYRREGLTPKSMAILEEVRVTEVAYWRKANAIHRWFVENVQNGADDCGHYPVTGGQLQELLAQVERVLAASELVEGTVVNGYRIRDGHEEPILEPGKVIKDATTAIELLPTQEGFFFGSTDYDDWYVKHLRDTKEMLVSALAEPGDSFEYTSSW